MALRDPEAGASPLALFGAELRHYRTAAGLSQEQLGDQIGYSAALVGAVETARRMPTEDFTARCDLVDELDTGGALLRLRAHLRDQLHRQVWPPWFREWPSIEREALSLRTWELALIPGLLQTADYARAILRGVRPDDTDEENEQQVDARIERQQILARQDPPMLWAIMDEGALHRPVGGRKSMRSQLDASTGRRTEAQDQSARSASLDGCSCRCGWPVCHCRVSGRPGSRLPRHSGRRPDSRSPGHREGVRPGFRYSASRGPASAGLARPDR